MSLTLADPVAKISGVGSRTAAALANQAVFTVADLLWRLPRRWEDRVNPLPISKLTGDSGVVTVCGTLLEVRVRRPRPRLAIVEAAVSDGETAIAVVWFNQPYLATTLKVGQTLWLHGTLRPGRELALVLQAPEWEVERDDGEAIHSQRLVPIYRRLGEFSGRRLRTLVHRTLTQLHRELPDPLAEEGLKEEGFPSLVAAFAETHFPTAPAAAEGRAELLRRLHTRTTPAQRRLALQELLGLAAVLEQARQARCRHLAVRCQVTEAIRARSRAALPFRLTAAQQRVIKDIVTDLQRPYPMARLLHGDVGAGKTVVAALAALVVAECGAQVAIMAPTELLAQQHHATFSRLLGPAGHVPALLIGSLSEAEKRAVRQGLATNARSIAVGTHAMFQEAVRFANLGLIIVDEQHRFGVSQRERLVEKGQAPHLLVMTATPIPRSWALALYGDLEVSVLDELPPGRARVRTVVREEEARARVLAFVAREIASGGQAYWVFPFIEESEDFSVRTLASHVSLVRRGLPGVAVGVVHGRMSGSEREQAMAAFAAGETAVLCATTVIEVGVDVPRASLMVIENAERFGLAQLHQLRGRVGRGGRKSYCVLLVGSTAGEEARQRLRRFVDLPDGFAVAEEDFRQRGPGEVTGLRQWGRPELVIADLRVHGEELERARAIARRWAERGRLDALVALAGAGGRRVGPA